MPAIADLGQVLTAFVNGSIASPSAFFSGTLVRMVPLALVGVGLAVSFRGGVFNIGGEGQFVLGAIAAVLVGLHGDALGVLGIPVALLASVLGGALWAGIAAILRTRFGVLEVISTIMLNFVAASLASYLVRGPLQEHTRVYPQTESIAVATRLPLLGVNTRLHLGIVLAVAIALVMWWTMRRTAWGFRVRTVGASPSAAAVAGRIDVPRVSAQALVVSGALAGLAGGIEVTGVTYALYENLSPGYGFSAIAVAILAGLRPLNVLATALLFAIIETGSLGMQRDAGVPAVVANVMEAAIILVVVWAAGVRWLARPASPAEAA